MAKKFVFNAPAPTGSNEDRPQIDFEALSEYVVDTVGCSEKPEALIGVISGVIDLGLQAQDDAKMVWTGDAASEAEELAKNDMQYFETLPNDQGVPTRYKRWAVKAQRCAAINVDFPSIMVNKGKFFDENGVGEDLPFRGLLNNEFGMKGVGKIVGKAYSLREQRNDDGSWSLKNNTILFKLGQATNQLVDGKFKPMHLGSLIGEAAMFNVHVFLNEHGGKKYLNEKMSFNGPVPKMMQGMIPVLDEKFMHVVNFTGDQDEAVLKTLRQSIINTMKMAEDFEGSDLQKALIACGKIKEGEAAPQAPQSDRPAQPQQAKPEAPKPQEPINFDSFDDDIPF